MLRFCGCSKEKINKERTEQEWISSGSDGTYVLDFLCNVSEMIGKKQAVVLKTILYLSRMFIVDTMATDINFYSLEKCVILPATLST